MQFLKNKGFTDLDIENLVEKYDDDTLETLEFNSENVEEVIDYLKEYGIKDIPKLMLNRIDIFYLSKKRINELFSNYEKESVILSLDYDANIFDEMLQN